MGSKINAGELRHQVTWQQNNPAATATSCGQVIANWTTMAVAFAKFEPLMGRELWNARQLKATVSEKLTMRGDVGDLLPSDRLLLDDTGRIFEIGAVLRPEEIDADMIVYVTEIKSPQ